MDDKIHGEGIIFFAGTGIIFNGKFSVGHCLTFGKILYPNGDIYFG